MEEDKVHCNTRLLNAHIQCGTSASGSRRTGTMAKLEGVAGAGGSGAIMLRRSYQTVMLYVSWHVWKGSSRVALKHKVKLAH